MKNSISPIVQVGAIGNPFVNDGTLLPYLTIDCSQSPDVEDFIEVHGDMPIPGDVISTWCWNRLSKKVVYLRLDFKRPILTSTHIPFIVESNGYVIDWIINVKGLYLQSSAHGNKASEGLGKPAIIVEIPSSTTFPIWPKLYRKSLVKRFRREGYSRNQLDGVISDYIRIQKELWFRRRTVGTSE